MCIEVDIALQVARQAQVVFQGSQDDGLGKEFYGPEFLIKGSQAEEINLLDKEHYVRVVKIWLNKANRDIIDKENLKQDLQFIK